MPGAALNTTASCLVLYDTSDRNGTGYCLARAGTGGTLDLRPPLSVMLYHELSHALRIVTTGLLALTVACNPASPEENAAITDENDMRTQLAALTGDPVILRDANIHCGGACAGGGGGGSCCIVASVSSGSPLSAEVQELRALREQLLRRSEVGFAFFDDLHYAYYGFSPQMVSVMAADLELREVVLEGFVRPLIRMLQLVRDLCIEELDAPELGRRFRDRFAGAETARADEAMVRAGGMLTSTSPAASDAERQVAELLATRALTDPHVRWALVEPVLAYHELLSGPRDGESDAALGARLVAFVDSWAGELPLSPQWGSLATEQVADELDMLESTLLRSAVARRRFLDRLAAEFGSATAIEAAVQTRLGGSCDE